MATLHVRNVPDDLYDRLKQRAAAERRTLSGEVIAILEDELGSAPKPNAADLEHLKESARAEYERATKMPINELLAEIDRTREAHPLPPGAPDVVDVIREGRER